jgi:precorrin-2/cobalt-factor-2 C20-methyltransferase
MKPEKIPENFPGKLYVLGAGPGDPELMTVKAVKILTRVKTIFVPKGRDEGESLALSIVCGAVSLEGKTVVDIHFPMLKTRGADGSANTGVSVVATPGVDGIVSGESLLDSKWDKAARSIVEVLKTGGDAAFVTLGDPTLYSTFYYVHERLKALLPDAEVELVPGVTSVTAAAARSGTYLGAADENIAIVPATYCRDVARLFKQFDTVVFMKVHRVLDEVLDALEAAGLADKAVYVSRATMQDEEVVTDVRTLRGKPLGYFSALIIKAFRNRE